MLLPSPVWPLPICKRLQEIGRALHNDQGTKSRGRHIIVNMYAPSIRAPQYIRQTLTDIKGEIDSNTIIVGDFNTPVTPMNRP